MAGVPYSINIILLQPTSTDDCYLEMALKSNVKKEDEPEKKLRCEECGKMFAFK